MTVRAVEGPVTDTLHVTNGDAAVQQLRAAGIPGDFLPWRDVLHEGPVPAMPTPAELRQVRALFLAQRGWAPFTQVFRDLADRDQVLVRSGDRSEVVLWFEHDLYDQLQLLDVLARLAAMPRHPPTVMLVCEEEYLGLADPARLHELWTIRSAVTPAQYGLAVRAWEAFRSPDVGAVRSLLAGSTDALPFLRAALERHLEEFPDPVTGLSRSERQILAAVASGMPTVGETYRAAHHAQEEAVFLADTVFAWYLERLSDVREPLVVFDTGETVIAPRAERAAGFWQRRLRLTETGRRVLAGDLDHIRLNGVDRWLGGVHLVRGPEAEAPARPA
jgi:hypothetical protein